MSQPEPFKWLPSTVHAAPPEFIKGHHIPPVAHGDASQQETRPTNLLSLNEDVLSDIVSYLPTPDALRLSETARSIHSVAKDWALSSVTIADLGRVGKFCEYFLEDIPNRLARLRELSIHKTAWEHETLDESVTGYIGAPLLLNLLDSAVNVRFLRLDCAEQIIRLGPRVVRPLVASSRLVELRLSSIGPRTLEAIKQLDCPLRELHMSGSEFRLRNGNLFAAIATMRSNHLQVIRISHVHEIPFPDAAEDLAVKLIGAAQYPRLRHISMIDCSDCTVQCSARYWPRLYPNIREIGIYNIVLNDTLTPRSQVETTWTSLDRLRGTVDDIRCLGINFPVWHVELMSVLSHLTEPYGMFHPHFKLPVDPAEAMSALIPTSPVSLVLWVNVNHVERAIWKDVAALQRLRCLRLELSDFATPPLYSDIQLINIIPWANQVIPCFAILKLFYIAISVYIDRVTYAYNTDLVDEIQRGLPFLLAMGIPSLSYVSVEFTDLVSTPFDDDDGRYRLPSLSSVCWRISRSGEQPSVQKVHVKCGQEIQQYMSLPEHVHALSLDDVLLRLSSSMSVTEAVVHSPGISSPHMA